MLERTPNKKILLIPVPNKNAETLNNIIKRQVYFESIIFIDSWKGYVNIKNEFSSHKAIYHSLEFEYFINNIHNNTIERNWAGMKQNLPIQCGIKKIFTTFIYVNDLKNSSGYSSKEFIKFLI
ncbi:hypothetical protein H312_00629 [Anncaliia algerae PRA339]|uniref:ISXO2-like transposase domain-containing protein n=1 Tax=Anncaliia algerae PRA339 TaxID=1288291 RepID=A0A059F4U7_9MICR|nr:hypothetical protein H312_00629 [Anncaliia algerae PRA339]